MHKLYGGVVPEIASRKHIEVIAQLADQALAQAGVSRRDIDAVAVTYAPGLIGAVLVGVSFAKAVACALGVPLIPVHHVRGHIAANYIAHPELEPPFVCLWRLRRDLPHRGRAGLHRHGHPGGHPGRTRQGSALTRSPG